MNRITYRQYGKVYQAVLKTLKGYHHLTFADDTLIIILNYVVKQVEINPLSGFVLKAEIWEIDVIFFTTECVSLLTSGTKSKVL